MSIKSKDLRGQILDLKTALDAYSYETLTASEAQQLKRAFDAFYQTLESRYWGNPETPSEAATSREKPREDDRVLAIVSHDIRTPLNGIVGFANLLEESTLNSTQQEYVRSIRAASETILNLIGDLMAFTRLKTNAETFNQEAFSPSDVLHDTFIMVQPLVGDKPIELECQVASGIPDRLLGDPGKLAQMVMNLLGNAVKFTTRGKVFLRAHSVTEADTCQLTIQVGDSGPGIPKEALPQIFDAYYQVNRQVPGLSSGVGLGLSIVKQLVEKQGGSISVESQPGVGSCFTFRIPYTVAPQLPAAPVHPEQPDARPLKGKRVLVFEDNVLNMKLMEVRLTSWGCRVFAASNATYGLALLKAEPVDAILMDLRMPDMDGYQASRLIREHANPVTRTLPIIAVTADLTAEDDQKCAHAGIDEVIIKPYSPDELMDKLIRLLNEKVRPADQPIAAAVPQGQGISLQGLLSECSGDVQMLEELIGLFRGNVLEFMGRMKIHLGAADYGKIHEAAHKVKAGLVLLGAGFWVRSVEEILAMSRAKTGMAQIRERFNGLSLAYPDLESQLDAGLQALKNPPNHE